MRRLLCAVLLLLPGAASAAPARPAAPPRPPAAAQGAGAPAGLVLLPPKIRLAGRGAEQRYLVLARDASGEFRDVTTQARVSAAGPGGVTVDAATRRLTATRNGEVQVTAVLGGLRAVMSVTVQGAEREPEWSFANEVVPIFTRTGCNSGGCHGSPSGRGGFRLSLLGYEPDQDYEMVVKDRNGKRVNTVQVSTSLILTKATGKVPHGGGKRFEEGSRFDRELRAWLAAGAPRQGEFDARLSRIEVFPTAWAPARAGERQPLVVLAHRDDGTTQDVTGYSRFASNDDQVAEVSEDGLLTAGKPGETAVMVRYLGGVAVVNVRVPRPQLPPAAYTAFQPANYVDEEVLARLREVRIAPSGPASDAEFLRRVTLDLTGATPTVEEARAFLDSKDPARRTRLVDELLQRPSFVEFWTLKWSDLLRNNQQAKQDKGVQVFHRWIREAVRRNKPWDVLARELITATGSAYRNGAANWYNTGDSGDEQPLALASATSQVFLGIRLDCARCHNHPFEAWSQLDYYGFAAFFARLKSKPGPDENERIFYAAAEGEVKHPRSGAVIPARLLGGDAPSFAAEEDRRERLAEWLTDPRRNPWFARSIANRLWNHFFGRGIVHPVDDTRLTNPAANEKLLTALANRLVAYKFDLQRLMRDIVLSRAYQASGTPTPSNANDRLYASRALPRRLYAEVLLDAIIYATGVPGSFGPYPRAVAIPDNRTGDGSGFLELFGRARRDQACECERPEETSVAMVLHLLTGPALNERLARDDGRVARAVSAGMPPEALIEEFYLAALSRRPSAKEQAAALKLLRAAPSPREGAEDLLWSLLNTREFLFNH
jgi:hypothetical protein